MLKEASVCLVVIVGYFLIVSADIGTENSEIKSDNEFSKANSTTEIEISTGKTDEHDEEAAKNSGNVQDEEDPSEAEISRIPKEFEEENREETTTESIDPRNVQDEEDPSKTKISRVPKRRKFEEENGEETATGENVDPEIVHDERDSSEATISRKPKRREFEEENDEAAAGDAACTAPPIIDGAVTTNLEDLEYRIGTEVTYECKFGYITRGSSAFFSVCKIDEQTGKAYWTHPNISCISRSCGDPGYVINARRIGNLFTFPNKVVFECDEGYKIRGVSTRYCQTSGEWSGRLPTCELVYCPPPPHPVNGRVRYISLEYGTELRYECNHGFVLRNHQPRICTGDGTWSNDEPQCIESACEKPDPPVRGSMRLRGEPKVGSLALFSCDEGTTLVGASTSKCLITGVWTFDTPKCLRSCNIMNVENGEMGRYERVRISKYDSRTRQRFVELQVGETVQHDETVVFRCKRGYSTENPSKDNVDMVMCHDGMWNKPLRCKPSECLGEPPFVDNASPVIDSRSHGKVIWYRCNNDFFREKSGKIQCDKGIWKGNKPICSDTRCRIDELNFPGLLKPDKQILKTGSYFEIHCKSGYKRISRKQMIKCAYGKWDIDSSPCEIETCAEDPPPVTNGSVSSFAREHGSLAQYECDEHFEMISDSTVRCEAGKWVGHPPTCQESVKNEEILPENARVRPNQAISEPKNLHTEECSCAYDYDTNLVDMTLNNRILNPEDRVEKGQIVTVSCPHPNTMLLWQNGMRYYGPINLTCSECKDWQRNDLPTCETQQPGDSMLFFYKMKILPGGAVEMTENENFHIRCLNAHIQPKWYPGDTEGIRFTDDPQSYVQQSGWYGANMNIDAATSKQVGIYECFSVNGHKVYRSTRLELQLAQTEIRCPELNSDTAEGNFIIRYDNDRKVHSDAVYSCRDNAQKLIGESSRKCLENEKWSHIFPSCADITCWKQPLYNGLVVTYSNDNKVNSIAKFRCPSQRTLVGSDSSTCQYDGKWSNPWPKCEILDIRCPVIDGKGIFSISYSNTRRIANSIANFYCIGRYKKLEGCNFVTCQQNGEWSGNFPTCVDFPTCVRFEDSPGLQVSYSNGVRVGSIASFQCAPPKTLLGRASSTCLYNGIWRYSSPICEDPICYIDTLMSSLPEGVVVDLKDVGEFVRYETELQLSCEDHLIHLGSPIAKCQSQEKWEYGNVQCVPGCRLNRDASSYLIIDPVKEHYRFGDFILLTCPPGQKLTSDVQRVMCLGKSWSDDIPDCVEMAQTTPLSLRETRKTA